MRSAGASSSSPPAERSVGALLGAARERLASAGCDSPALDAELLLGEVLEVDRATLHREPLREAGTGEAARFERLVRRREAREPVAYILGRKGFRRIELAVDPRVLVPRPETELLVEVALGLPRGAHVADVGSGSGAIALALKHERPDLELTAIDASSGALEVAAANAATLGLDVAFLEGDLLAPLATPPDAVLANLPYVAEQDRALLAPEITEHEPPAALFVPGDGLALVRELLRQAAGVAFVALEVGLGQAGAVAEAARAAGCREVRAERDLAGIERVVVARR